MLKSICRYIFGDAKCCERMLSPFACIFGRLNDAIEP